MATARRALTYILYPYLFLWVLPGCIDASVTDQKTHESDRITSLPGQPTTPSISQFSGYINVNQDHGRALFYWFFEALSEPSNKPLVLWLNGGPGCSSIGYGAAVELGPLRVLPNGTGLSFNQHSWIQEANLLFLESPAGVGFSYTNTSSDIDHLDDAFVAEDTYNFLALWLEKHPQFKTRDFYIAGESYSGHYTPQLAELIYDRNQMERKYPAINLKGFIVGNAVTDDYNDYKGLLEYAWSHAVISDQLYHRATNVCDFKVSSWSDDCNDAMNTLFKAYKEIDIYNIYAPSCITNSSASAVQNAYGSFKELAKGDHHWFKRIWIPGGYDPCYSQHAEKYFNREDVQSSFHATIIEGKWRVCNDPILRKYNFTVFSMLPVYSKLIKAGLKIWVYSGDIDGRVPVIGSRYSVEALGLPVKSPWRSWFHNRQVGGRIVEYKGLTFATVRGAGHLVPLNKPGEALALFHSFLTGEELPSHP